MFFILWGTRIRWSRAKETAGQFFCPNCGGDRAWRSAFARRWFTLFFIPLFPTGKPVAEVVECETCQTRFKKEVLATPTSGVLSAQLEASMRLAACAVLRDAPAANAGGGRSAAISTAIDAVRQTGMAGYDNSALEHDLGNLDLAPLPQHLSYLAEALELPGREHFIASLTAIAASGGFLDAARPTLEQIGAMLGLSTAHVAGVIAQAPSGSSLDDPPSLQQ